MKKSKRSSTEEKTSQPFWLLAALLAWLIPGAGHVYAGRRVRGIILFITITATFWTGIAVGGVMTVDSHYHPKWFYAQAMTGISGAVSWYRQHLVYQEVATELNRDLSEFRPRPDERPSEIQLQEVDVLMQERGIALAAPAEDVARAYSGVAGMMNLLVVFDILILCLMGRARETIPEEKKEEGEPAKKEGKDNA